jgi:hypothetical protein
MALVVLVAEVVTTEVLVDHGRVLVAVLPMRMLHTYQELFIPKALILEMA